MDLDSPHLGSIRSLGEGTTSTSHLNGPLFLPHVVGHELLWLRQSPADWRSERDAGNHLAFINTLHSTFVSDYIEKAFTNRQLQ